jgi:hypothetical protein
MRARYDFAQVKSRRNPFAGRLKRSVTIRLDDASIAYFKELAGETGVPYQSLINLYLRDCIARRLRLAQRWEPGDDGQAENDPRFLARIAQARASLRQGRGIPWDEVQTESESPAAEFTASDKPTRRSRRHGPRK